MEGSDYHRKQLVKWITSEFFISVSTMGCQVKQQHQIDNNVYYKKKNKKKNIALYNCTLLLEANITKDSCLQINEFLLNAM